MAMKRLPSCRAACRWCRFRQRDPGRCRPGGNRQRSRAAGCRWGRRRSVPRAAAGSAPTTHLPGSCRAGVRRCAAAGRHHRAPGFAAAQRLGLRAVLGAAGAAAGAGAARAAGTAGVAARAAVWAPISQGTTVRLADGVEIEPVVPLLDEQKDQLVPGGKPVGHRLRHGVGLVPHHGIAQDPAVGLQREGDPPRHPEQVLGRQRQPRLGPDGRLPPVVVPAARPPVGVGRVAVAQVQPQGAVVDQDPSGFGEGGAQRLHLPLRRLLMAELAGAVIAQPVVGRAGDDGVRRPIGHLVKHLAGVTVIKGGVDVNRIDVGYQVDSAVVSGLGGVDQVAGPLLVAPASHQAS